MHRDDDNPKTMWEQILKSQNLSRLSTTFSSIDKDGAKHPPPPSPPHNPRGLSPAIHPGRPSFGRTPLPCTLHACVQHLRVHAACACSDGALELGRTQLLLSTLVETTCLQLIRNGFCSF